MAIWKYIFLFLTVILGGGLAFLFKNRSSREFLGMVLSFSGAYLLGVIVLHLIPTVFKDSSDLIGLWVLGGFLAQLILDQLSRGVEHGHVHKFQDKGASLAVVVLIGLSIHAFFEGLPLPHYEEIHELSHEHNHFVDHLFWGIILHKTPAAFALALLLILSGFKNKLIWVCLVVFALMSPLGSFVTDLLVIDYTVQRILLAFVIGSFLHISTTILFEVDSNKQHSISFKRLIATFFGIGLALLTIL